MYKRKCKLSPEKIYFNMKKRKTANLIHDYDNDALRSEKVREREREREVKKVKKREREKKKIRKRWSREAEDQGLREVSEFFI